MTDILFIVEEAAEGGYTARAVGTSIFAEVGDLDRLRDAGVMLCAVISTKPIGRKTSDSI